MKLDGCLGKLSNLLTEQERAELSSAMSGKDDAGVMAEIERMAAEARADVDAVLSDIASQQAAAAPAPEPEPKAPETLDLGPFTFNSDRNDGKATLAVREVPELAGKIGEPPMVVVDRANGTALSQRQAEAVAAAINDLLSRGMPRGLLDGVRSFYVREGRLAGEYHIEGQSIGISADVLDAAAGGNKHAIAALRGMLAHEIAHHEDEDPQTGVPASVKAEQFELEDVGTTRVPRGKMVTEAFIAWRKGGEFGRLMDYPFSQYKRHTSQNQDAATAAAGYTTQDFTQMLQQEVYAQLRRLWWTNPTMLRTNAPSAYSLFEEMQDGQPEGKIGGHRRALREGLQRGRSADGNRRGPVAGAANRQDGRGAGVGAGDTRVGAAQLVRSAAATRNVRAGEVAPEDLVGDGRGFTEFFTDATTGGRKPNTGKAYEPVLDIPQAEAFSAEYVKHRGNFDDHIATSIPGFREVQQAVGNAIAKTLPEGRVLDVGASEGSFIKAITAVSGGKVKTVGLDPNVAMGKFFEEHSSVPGSTYEVKAFSARANEGELAWTEDDGTEIYNYTPDGKFDVVHEAMTFQFISNARGAQVARVKELLKPGGVALFEQKFIPTDKAEYAANEKKKDAYKAGYYSAAELDRKKKDVLERGEKAVAAEEKAKEEKIVGMHDLMVSPTEFERVLRENFENVVQYWDSGNFKGYAASDSASDLSRLVSNIGDLNSEYSTIRTPAPVTRPDRLEIKIEAKPNRGDATLEDFKPGKVAKLLKKKNWAVLTAENPDAKQMPPDVNAARNARLERDLKKMGVPYEKVIGKYGGNDEHSFVAVNITPEQANELRDKYRQDSVLTREGLVHSDGSVTPATGLTEHATAPEDFFTSTASGAYFSVDLDFDARTKPTKVPRDLEKFITDEEKAVLEQGSGRVARLMDVMKELPPTKEFEHAALAGRAARGWYKRSREAVEATYGPDAPRFIALMAALSPQTDVEGNFYNAAMVWHAWDNAGRPQDHGALRRIFTDKLVTDAGREGGKSAMEAWAQNSIRVLTSQFPERVILSGPKVESFRRNLMGDMYEVTNDRHNAAFGGIDQALFGGSKTAGSEVSGKAPGYIAFSARMREAAANLTKATGETWTPAEAQETLWSFWKALYDLTTAKGETRSAVQLIRDGALTHEMVSRVPDLGSYINEPRYKRIAGARGEAVARGAAEEAGRGAGRVARETGAIAATPAVERIARRVDRLIAKRKRLEELKAEIAAQDEALDEAGVARARELEQLEEEIATAEEEARLDDAIDFPAIPRRPERLEVQAGEPPLWESGLQLAVAEKAPFSKDGSIAVPVLKSWLEARTKDGIVKAEEMKWSGVEEWLDVLIESDVKKLSRDEVTNFIAKNGVQVTEKMLGEAAPPPGLKIASVGEDGDPGVMLSWVGVSATHNTEYDAALELAGKMERIAMQWQRNGDAEKAKNFFARAEELQSWADGLEGMGGGDSTQYGGGDLVLPGGTNYKELLLTLPTEQNAPARKQYQLFNEDGELIAVGDLAARERWVRTNEVFEGNHTIGEALVPDVQGAERIGVFQSSHYKQPNILAHVRFNERTSSDGKRVLFLEEVQSDWAQKGRREGFAEKPMTFDEWRAGNSTGDLADDTRRFAVYQELGDPVTGRGGMTRGVPSGPFVGKTEAWVALAMKRMMRYAVDNGFDAIAWTNGEQQAARYDLSKHISKVIVDRVAPGLYDVAVLENGESSLTPLMSRTSLTRLDDHIGKELAEKVRDHYAGARPNRRVEYSGLDLKVGGEGMVAFYEKIVPGVANDLLKKMGGGRTGEIRLNVGNSPARVFESSDGRFNVLLDTQNGVDLFGTFDSKEQAKSVASGLNSSAQPGFEIPEAVAQKARRPQRLFVQAGPMGVVQERISDILQTQRSFNQWHRGPGTQYHKAQIDDDFRPVYEGVQDYLNDSSRMMMEASDLAPDILPRLSGLRDVLRAGPGKEAMQKVSDAVFDGTLQDRVFTDAELTQRGLDAKQIGLYRQARSAIDRVLDEAFASEAVQQGKGLLPQAVLDRAKEAGDGWIVVDALSAIPMAQRQPVHQQVYDQLRLRAAEISDLKRDGYAPLMRFGQYTVTVRNANGDVELFTMHETETAANAMARAVREDPAMQGMAIEQGVMAQEAWKLFQGVSPDTLEVFAQALDATQKEVFQKYLKFAVNNRSVLKRLMRRKKIAGFTDDVQRTLAQFITSTSRAAARNYHWGDVLKAAEKIPNRKGDVKDEAAKLIEYVRGESGDAGGLRGLLFVQFLGGSVASAAVNATQPVLMSFPYLSQYGGAAKAAARLAGATKVALGGQAEPGLADAMRKAAEEGITDPHEVAGLYAESIRNFGSNMFVRRALRVWGSFFSLAEAFNRRLTFVAAYRTAVDQGIADPYAFAVKAIAETQGVYNKGNRPDWARGPVGATLMTFKQYSISYLEFLKRLPPKERAIAVAVLILAAGLQGLPGADDAEDVIDTIAESLGYSFNSKRAMREWAVNTLGEPFGEFLVNGFSSLPGVPLDVQARLGIGNLIPGTAMFKRSEPNKAKEVLDVFGPAGGQAKAVMQGFSAAQEGDYGAAGKALVPLAIRNALKGLEMAQTGWYKDERGRRVIDVDAVDSAIKSTGFQPSKVAKQTRAVMDMQQTANLQRDVESRIAETWARGIVEKDPEKVQRARAELIEWNMTNPEARVMISPSQVQQRVKQMLMTREQRFLKAAPAELRQSFAKELRG